MFASFETWVLYDEGNLSIYEMFDSNNLAFVSVGVAALWTWVAGILFIVWSFQAYKSAESRGATGRRWSAGWTIGAWFIPLANMVIPKMVMNEVDRISNPLTGEIPVNDRWKAMPRMIVSDLWWIAYLVGLALWWIGIASYASAPGYEGQAVGFGYLVLSLSLALYAAGATLAGVMVYRIGRRLRPQST